MGASDFRTRACARIGFLEVFMSLISARAPFYLPNFGLLLTSLWLRFWALPWVVLGSSWAAPAPRIGFPCRVALVFSKMRLGASFEASWAGTNDF